MYINNIYVLINFVLRDERIPLRDAVEHRAEPYFDNSLDHESIWLEQLSPPAVRKVEKEFKIVCHLDAGAVYRMEPFNLLPQAIPTRKCTHLVYNSATIGSSFSLKGTLTSGL